MIATVCGRVNLWDSGGAYVRSSGGEAIRHTRDALEEGADVLFELAFQRNEALVRADILKEEEGGWHLIEVKSSSRLKPEMIEDVAFQQYVTEEVDLSRLSVMHLNKEFTPAGDAPPDPVFTRTCKGCTYQERCWSDVPEHTLFDLLRMHYTWTDFSAAERPGREGIGGGLPHFV